MRVCPVLLTELHGIDRDDLERSPRQPQEEAHRLPVDAVDPDSP
jgi:hypothetical protein